MVCRCTYVDEVVGVLPLSLCICDHGYTKPGETWANFDLKYEIKMYWLWDGTTLRCMDKPHSLVSNLNRASAECRVAHIEWESSVGWMDIIRLYQDVC